MKAKAIVKICICGTIALVLASVLVSLLAIPRVLDWKIGDLSLHWIDDHGSDEGYTVGEASVSGEVRELDVSWLSGSVTVELTDGDAVTLREEPQPRAVMPYALEAEGRKINGLFAEKRPDDPDARQAADHRHPGRPGREAAEAQPRPQRSYGFPPGTDAP